jgi:hypothetical protein
MSFTAGASDVLSDAGDGTASVPNLSFSDLLIKWGAALIDPATYTTWAHINGFFDFLMNETFLSALSSNAFGSLSRSSILGTIPNIFFAVCILSVSLSVAVAIMELNKLDMQGRAIKNDRGRTNGGVLSGLKERIGIKKN